jgi:hypothetical protein
LELLLFSLLFLASAYFFGAILLILQESNFTFRLDSNQQFQEIFGFLLDYPFYGYCL